MLSRIEEQIDKKNKKFKRTSRFVIFLSLVFVLTTISLSTIIYIKYRSTQNWTSSKLNSSMSNITPEFAKNTYTVEMADDINRLNNVTSILEKIRQDNGLTDETIKSANIAYDESQSILKKYNITTGEAIKNQDTLKMYIDIYNVEQSAYKKPETKQLEQLIAMLNKKLIEKENETDNVILKRLNTIVSDYQALNTFSDTFIPQLGEIKNGIITVKSDITEEMTNQILTSIDDAHLDKFANIKKLKTIMRSTKWNKIINSNMQLSEKQKWENIYAAFSALSASQYIEVSKVRTLADAEQLGIKITGNQNLTGYEILKTSPVTHLQANGEVVNSGQYVRKDSEIIATINPMYKPIPTPSKPNSSTTTESEEKEPKTSTSSSSETETSSSSETETSSSSSETEDSSSSETEDSSSSETENSSAEPIELPPSTTQHP